MKKIGIGIAIFIVFLAYTHVIRDKNPVIATPAALKNNTAASASLPNTSTPSGSGTPPTASTTAPQTYKDGTFTGSVADAYYGNVQVSATISGGKITDIKFLQYPDTHQTSVVINQQAIPYLKQEAIQSQTSNVQIISGATFTSQAFQQSLQAALSQA